MPFAVNQGINICYEVVGQGPPLVLAHGATGDSTFWTGYGYVDALKDLHTVILFDARGHGRSDKPHDVALYHSRLMVGDVLAVMDAVSVRKASYWGYSMGGHFGFALAAWFPDRLTSLIVGGSSPYNRDDKSEPRQLLKIIRQGARQGADAAVDAMRAWAGHITPQYEKRLRALDFQAMEALLEAYQFHRPGLDRHLAQIDVPCLIYAGGVDRGTHEYGQEAVQAMPNGRFHSLPGLDHVGAGSATEQVLPLVLSFLEDVADRG